MLQSSSSNKVNRAAAILNSLVEASVWRKSWGKYIIATDYFGSYEHFVMRIASGNRPKDGEVAELMCHPGHDNYKNEFRMIQERVLQQYISDMSLISYKEL